jgi:ferredoxin
MENKQSRIIRFLGFIQAVFVILALSACTNNSPKKDVSQSSSLDNGDNSKASGQTSYSQGLSVLEHRCVGCGKCARIDPEHFSMDGTSRKAVVTSTENLQSSDLSLAVSMCQADAIELS